MIKKIKIFIILLIVTSLTACGFHLRGYAGDYKFPFKTIFVECDQVTICYNFTNAIKTQTLATIVNNLESAEVVVTLYNEQTSRHAQGYNVAGRISSYALNYQVEAKITQKGEELGKPIQISVNSNVNYNDSQILAANQDEASHWEDMHINATNQLIRRLVYFKYYKNPNLINIESANK